MLHASDPRFQHCVRVSKVVSVCQSEAQCRSKYGCTKPNCPLERAFGFPAFDQRMKAFATAYDLWPFGGTAQPDYP